MTFLIETIAAGDATLLRIIHVLFLSKVSDTEIGSDIYWKPWSFFPWFLPFIGSHGAFFHGFYCIISKKKEEVEKKSKA